MCTISSNDDFSECKGWLILDNKAVSEIAVDKLEACYNAPVKNEDEFEILKNSIGNEIRLFLINRQFDLINKINPISEKNFEEVKSRVGEIIKEIHPEFASFSRVKMERCQNSTELFSMVKGGLSNDIQSFFEKKIRNLCTEVNAKEISVEEFDEKLIELNFRCIKCTKDLLEIFTPKTINKEVLKLEQQVRDLGVKSVNFANELDQALLIKEAVIDIVKTKIKLPESITVTTIIPFGTRGYNIKSIIDKKPVSHLLFLTAEEKKFNAMIRGGMCELAPHTKAFKNASEKMQNKYLETMGCACHYIHSTTNPKHQVYHEIAHSFSPMSLEVLSRKLSSEDLEIAKSVSPKAASCPTGKEVVPEIFAKLMDKQHLTPAQMELYRKLGGIVPLH